MNVFHGIILGLIQGLGEFLPISSSGHLLLARFFLGIQGETPEAQSALKLLDIMLHFGTLIPVLLVFWKEWIDMICHPVRNKTLLYLFIASVPTLVLYFIAKILFPVQKGFAVFDNGWFLGASFLISAVFLLLCDLFSRKHSGGKKVGPIQAVIMGIFQGIGLIPGVSRSGSTIFGGVLSGLDRKKAAVFSFMMSAPAIVGSLLLEGKEAFESGEFAYIQIVPAIAGILVAAVSGFFAIRFMLRIIEKISLGWFALYLAIIGFVYLALQLAGVAFIPSFSPFSSSVY